MENSKIKNKNSEESESPVMARRPLSGLPYIVFTVVAVTFGLFQLILAMDLITLTKIEVRTTHLTFALILAFLIVPAFKKSPSLNPSIIDYIWVILSIIANGYLFIRYDQLVMMGGSYDFIDIIMGALLILVLFEAARRATSKGLVVLALLALLFAYFGRSMPGPFVHTGYSVERIIQHLYLTGEGIYGFILGVSSTTIVTFIIFGAFLQSMGVSAFFYDLANSITGKSKGGPAKIATISSGLMGTVTGDTSGNVATTGVFTIPLMKRVGYKSHFAGGIECAASAGGQIMPPVMGATAFVIADTIGVPFLEIAVAAILPAILYYAGVFATIHFRAHAADLKGLDESQIPKFRKVIPKAYLMLPLVGIVYFLVKDYTPVFSAFWGGIVFTVALSFFNKETRLNPKRFMNILVQASKTTISIAIATALVGVIVGIASLTGVTISIADTALAFTGGVLIPTLILAMIVAIVMGMGLPTTAAYVLTSISAAPVLTSLGIPLLASHLFVLFFGVMSALTPPVATGAYTAGGIANAHPTKVGLSGLAIAFAGFIVPFMFIFNPSLLLGQGYSITEAILPFITGVLGIILISSGNQGYLFWRLNKFGRVILFVGGVALVFPSIIISLIGVGLFALSLLQKITKKITSNIKENEVSVLN